MKINKTHSINIQTLAFISHCGRRVSRHKASGVRGVLLIANGRKNELRVGNDATFELMDAILLTRNAYSLADFTYTHSL
ncbi:hypothetical protein LC608_32575 [Nostoc sp. XA010]|uniref:hypothetical protein n=1 Tax=Nostoc sp. XA010 TaxID=2780407 RepID=UPI001E284E58|nr:hypothetical protein [Nostoc sp. XA010]MCC5661600.1 hypothetical protein [Nostoc sp. XA010]